MARSISRTEKRSRGRPRKDPFSIHLTLLPDRLSALDQWIAKQGGALTRPQAIRLLVDLAIRLPIRRNATAAR
jgi:hypothetical protein